MFSIVFLELSSELVVGSLSQDRLRPKFVMQYLMMKAQPTPRIAPARTSDPVNKRNKKQINGKVKIYTDSDACSQKYESMM